MFTRMYPFWEHMISCSNLCNTSCGQHFDWRPHQPFPSGFHLLSQHSLQFRWPWDTVHDNQTHAGASWRTLEKLLLFQTNGLDSDGTIPVFPPRTWMGCPVLWRPSETPEEWCRESQSSNSELWQGLSCRDNWNKANNCLLLGFLLSKKRERSIYLS